MTGPEHYREAEHLLNVAGDNLPDTAGALVRIAQVHATLALAFATDPLIAGDPDDD